MGFKDKIRQGLERDVQSNEVLQIFSSLQEHYPVLRRFRSAVDLVKQMHEKKIGSYGERDEIITILVKEYQKTSANSALGSLLTMLFWPAIDHIYNSKKGHVADKQELWSQILWVFTNVILQYSLSKRPVKLAINIKLDTLMKVHRWLRKESKYRTVITLVESEKDLDKSPASERRNTWAEHELNQAQTFLWQFVDEKVITEADYYLILGTRVYGELLKDYATEHGFGFEAVMKQRQRAEKAIQKHLRLQTQKNSTKPKIFVR